jgi:hypothetical protein
VVRFAKSQLNINVAHGLRWALNKDDYIAAASAVAARASFFNE